MPALHVVLMIVQALCAVYHSHGRDREAEPLCWRVLEIQQRTLNADDPTIAVSLNNLADVVPFDLSV